MTTKSDVLAPRIERGINVLDTRDLIKKAASLNGIPFILGSDWKVGSRPGRVQRHISVVRMSNKLIEWLGRSGINNVFKDDGRSHGVLDEGQPLRFRFELQNTAFYWEFEGCAMQFNIGVEFHFPTSTGITLSPTAYGGSELYSEDSSTHTLFSALVRYADESFPEIMWELSQYKKVAIPWSDLGYPGIKKVDDLFLEFAAHNKILIDLARHAHARFELDPLQPHTKDLFLTADIQPAIISLWQKEFNVIREGLLSQAAP